MVGAWPVLGARPAAIAIATTAAAKNILRMARDCSTAMPFIYVSDD